MQQLSVMAQALCGGRCAYMWQAATSAEGPRFTLTSNQHISVHANLQEKQEGTAQCTTSVKLDGQICYQRRLACVCRCGLRCTQQLIAATGATCTPSASWCSTPLMERQCLPTHLASSVSGRCFVCVAGFPPPASCKWLRSMH